MSTEAAAIITHPRAADGRWRAGVSGNPAGRPKGARNKATVLAERLSGALDEEAAEALLRRLVEKAQGGDGIALRFLLARLFPVPRSAPVTLDLPEGAETDPVIVFEAAIRAMAAGEITPEEALAIARTLRARPVAAPAARAAETPPVAPRHRAPAVPAAPPSAPDARDRVFPLIPAPHGADLRARLLAGAAPLSRLFPEPDRAAA